MKTVILFIISLLSPVVISQVSERYVVCGELSGETGDSTIVVLMQEEQSRFDADISILENKKFRISGTLDLEYPEVFSIIIENPNQTTFKSKKIFISPEDSIYIKLNVEDIEKSEVYNSSINDDFMQYVNEVEQSYDKADLSLLLDEYERAVAAKDSIKIVELTQYAENIAQKRLSGIIEYIRTHPKSYISAYSLYSNRNMWNEQQMAELIDLLDKDLHRSKYINDILRIDRAEVGNLATDFILKDVDGNDVVFSAIAEGKIVLLEFWASWCAPCREANMKLEKLYTQYRKQNFEIIGISLDRDTKTLRNSIEKDGISWLNLLDRKGQDSVNRLYNLNSQSIPANVLINKDGIIVAKNLNADEIEDQIIDLLK